MFKPSNQHQFNSIWFWFGLDRIIRSVEI